MKVLTTVRLAIAIAAIFAAGTTFAQGPGTPVPQGPGGSGSGGPGFKSPRAGTAGSCPSSRVYLPFLYADAFRSECLVEQETRV